MTKILSPAVFRPVRSPSKSHEVFEKLRTAIVSRQLQPGTALRETVLASEMQVSQVPVREALLRLEGIGLVHRIPDRSTKVVELSRRDMVEMVHVRAHLEDLAFRLATHAINEEIVVELRDAAQAIHASADVDDYYASAEADLRFHRIVWSASGNATLATMLERLCNPFYAFVSQQRQSSGEHLSDVTSEHDVLINALLTRDEARVSAAIREHVTERSSLPAQLLADR